jgi:CRISPR-associated protein Csd1
MMINVVKKMGWMQKCYETYENNLHMAGEFVDGSASLCPLYHIVQKAQIEVSIDHDGSFVNASAVPKGREETIIPVSERSGSRSSGVEAHMLCDGLQYLVLGNERYPGHNKPGAKYEQKYKDYIEKLGSWAGFDKDNWKLQAIYRYCLGGTLVDDLAAAGIVEINEKGELTDGKVNGTPYDKCLVRWRVLGGKDDAGQVWMDQQMFKSFEKFREHVDDSKKQLCYVSGETATAAVSFPKGIVKVSNSAKLVSANDSAGFTYRGRFISSDEAMTISSSVSQKAHSALSWLAANQGKCYGGRTYICWNTLGKPVPQVSFSLFDQNDSDEDDSNSEIDDKRAYTEPDYKEKIAKALNGYRVNFTESDGVVIIALDAATTGRLSVTYYSELKASDFLDRIESWHDNCAWYRRVFTKDKKIVTEITAPTIMDIINTVYGTDRGDFIKTDDKVVKDSFQRIFKCIADKHPIPHDIVHDAVNKASRPTAYSNFSEREKVLSTTCALIRKNYKDKYGKEVFSMAVDENNLDRSYLFGRLLAIQEKVEKEANKKSGVEREVNAMRFQSAFVQHPMHTFTIIENQLMEAYYPKLSQGEAGYYKKMIGNVFAKLPTKEYQKLNAKLDDIYLIGYYLQLNDFYTPKKDKTTEETENK